MISRKSIWLVFLVSACNFSQFDDMKVADLDFGDPSNTLDIFVKGGITSELAYHQLIIEKPGSFLNETSPEIVTDATVRIINEQDTIEYILIDTVRSPFYRTKQLFKAEPGHKYSLQIDYNGKLYMATDSMTIVDPFEYDSIILPAINTNYAGVQVVGSQSLIYMDMQKHNFGFPEAHIWVWVPVAGNRASNYSESYLLENNGKLYTHWTSDPNAIFSFNTYYSGIGPIVETDTLLTAKYSISSGYYQYLISLFSETDWNQGEFATQSGNLHTNFSNGAGGYFYVSDYYSDEISMKDLLELIE